MYRETKDYSRFLTRINANEKTVKQHLSKQWAQVRYIVGSGTDHYNKGNITKSESKEGCGFPGCMEVCLDCSVVC